MKYRDELQIAGTAILLCCAMFTISAVMPKGNSTSTASTTFKEAPETAAEAEKEAEKAAEEAGFTIYTQEIYDSSQTTTNDSSGQTDGGSLDNTQPSGEDNSVIEILPDQEQPETTPEITQPATDGTVEPPSDIGQDGASGSTDGDIGNTESNDSVYNPDNTADGGSSDVTTDGSQDVSGNVSDTPGSSNENTDMVS